MESLKIENKLFDELSVHTLYALLKLRTDVFVVEQECAYPELDNYDKNSTHVIGVYNEEIVAYARVVAPGDVYTEASIGRVAVAKEFRHKGFGRLIFERALKVALEKYPKQKLKIQGQCYLEKFYTDFGFKTISEPYPDVGIWHVDMIYDH